MKQKYRTMKTYNILLLTIATLLAVACISNNEFYTEKKEPSGSKNIRIITKDFIWHDSKTKSTVEADDNGVKFKWSENDTIGIFPMNGFQVAFPMASGAGTNSAEFNGGDWKLREASAYAAYYPFNFYNKSGKNISVTYIGQVQNGNDNTGHIGSFDYLSASARTPSTRACA